MLPRLSRGNWGRCPQNPLCARCVSSAASSALGCTAALQSFAPGALSTQRCGKASYVASFALNRSTQRQKKQRKAYNYLTGSRMLDAPRKGDARQTRLRDDKNLVRRSAYKERLVRDVEEKIQFFPPFLKRHVFFPKQSNSSATLIFTGHRDVGYALHVRVVAHVLAQLKKAENRPLIEAKLKELDFPLPTAEEWRRFTDAKTGDINVSILYSKWMNGCLTTLSRSRGAAEGQVGPAKLRVTQAYIITHLLDPTKVPSLEEAARAAGPLTAADMVSRSAPNSPNSLQSKKKLFDFFYWGKEQITTAVTAMTLEEVTELVRYATENRDRLFADVMAHHVFCAKISAALYALPEIRALVAAKDVFQFTHRMRAVIESKGSYYLPNAAPISEFQALTDEEKVKWTAFGYVYERIPTTGQKLYIRYCVRDYGQSLSEALRRYGQLSELQRAAICFPFYMPIAARAAQVAGYRRFYKEMCARYGLVHASGSLLGNRIFEGAMRKRWRSLTADERARYEDSDRFASVFPLVKPADSEDATAAAATSSRPTAAAMAEYFTEDGAGASASASLDELVARAKETATAADAAVTLPAVSATATRGTAVQRAATSSRRRSGVRSTGSSHRREAKEGGEEEEEGLRVIVI